MNGKCSECGKLVNFMGLPPYMPGDVWTDKGASMYSLTGKCEYCRTKIKEEAQKALIEELLGCHGPGK